MYEARDAAMWNKIEPSRALDLPSKQINENASVTRPDGEKLEQVIFIFYQPSSAMVIGCFFDSQLAFLFFSLLLWLLKDFASKFVWLESLDYILKKFKSLSILTNFQKLFQINLELIKRLQNFWVLLFTMQGCVGTFAKFFLIWVFRVILREN